VAGAADFSLCKPAYTQKTPTARKKWHDHARIPDKNAACGDPPSTAKNLFKIFLNRF
jgi:hypothetical protein